MVHRWHRLTPGVLQGVALDGEVDLEGDPHRTNNIRLDIGPNQEATVGLVPAKRLARGYWEAVDDRY